MISQHRFFSLFGALLTAICLSTSTVAEEETAAEFDGLVRVPDSSVAMAYIDPNADFSVFTRVAVLDPLVAFRSNWKRDQNRTRTHNIRPADVERIKADVAALFRDVFVERLENAGYEITTDTADDVLVVRPAIIDIDLTAPDIRAPGRSRTYTSSTGSATLYIQLLDAVSGDVIGRAADRRRASRGGMINWSNRVTNRADARRMFGIWADTLTGFLASQYNVQPAPQEASED